MKFVIDGVVWDRSFELLYRPESFAFDVNPRPRDAVSSVLVNDTELEVDDEGTVLCVTGLCPHPAWQHTELRPPESRKRTLRVESDSPWVPGIAKRLTEAAAWPIFVDRDVGFVCVGDPAQRAEGVEFAPGCIAVVNRGDLLALWLRPKQLPLEIVNRLDP